VRRAGPILILLIGLAALFIDFFPNAAVPGGDPDAGGWRELQTKLGLDLEGGLRVEYLAQEVDGVKPDAGALGVIRDIVEDRVNTTGVSEPVVQTQGADRIVVELPGVTNPDAIRRLVGQTGLLNFVPLGTTQMSEGDTIDLERFPPLFPGSEVSSASIGQNQQSGLTVNFQLKDNGAKLFGDYTRDHVGEYFAIVLDGKIVSAPRINSSIPGGQVQIEAGGVGGFPVQEANNLVTVLKFGSLPFPIVELSSEQISATLGERFLNQSLLAGAIGIGLVMLFMLIYYRLPGLVASFALLYYGIVVLAIFRLIPVTLTLAGIAGFVLSVGMAVDANILIFERTKEELRSGKSLVSAVEAGFNRAWNSIFDSNMSSIITAGILFYFGSATIRGFALVLIIGVLVSMFTAVTLSRQMLRVLVHQPWARKARYYGVAEDEFLIAPPTARTRRQREASADV